MIPDTEIINSQLMNASAELTVTIVCRAFGISRSVFYYRRKRYDEYGLLQSRSKRPKRTRTIDEGVQATIAELHRTYGWKAARIARALAKQGVRVSEKTARKYIPTRMEIQQTIKYPQRQYGRLEQLQLDVKGRIYIGKQKLYPIGLIDRGTRVAVTELRPSFKADAIIEVCDTFIESYGRPRAITTDNHRCFRSKRFNGWLAKHGIQHRYPRTKSPWQNGYIESFFKTMETEFLRGHFFHTMDEAATTMNDFLTDYNTTRYHTAIRCARAL